MKLALSMTVALAIACVACGKDDASTTSPSTTTTKTDSFTGTVPIGGSAMNTFTVGTSGPVTVTMTAAGPPAAIVMGLGVGVPANGICGVLAGASVTATAAATSQLGGVVSPGSYCVTVYDVGNQTAPITYTVSVVHP